MSLELGISPPADPRWRALLDEVEHDFYHLPAYVELEAKRLGGEPIAAWVREGERALLLPLVTRPLPEPLSPPPGRRDATSPYGSPGLLEVGGAAPEWRGEALRALCEGLRERGLVTLFVRLHPLLDQSLVPTLAKHGDVVEQGPTVVIPLDRPMEQVLMSMTSTTRNRIRRCQREGFRVRRDVGLERMQDFVSLYHATMSRVEADPRYHFEREYLTDLCRRLAPAVSLQWVEAPGGELAAGAIFSACSGVAQYHLSCSDPAFGKLSPTRLLIYEGLRWAQDRGARCMHLGGGLGGRADALFRFKASFGGERARFHTWRSVLDLRLYDALSAAAAQGGAPPGDFFPAYRSP